MGFLFLVLYPLLLVLLPPLRLPPHTHSHSLTHTHSHSLTLTHSLTHSHSLTLTHTHHSHSLTHSLTLTHSHSLTHTLTLTHTHSLTHSHIHTFNHSLTHTHHSHSLTHTLTHTLTFTHSHSLTHSLAFLFCVAGVAQRALPRGRMYALASLRCPLVSAAFAWQAWHNVHCQGVGCTPWRPSGVPWSPPLLRGRRGTTCTAKGSDVRPGVPPVSLGLRRFCVAGVAQRALPRGRMYALASLRCPLVSAAFAWHCQGVGCTPWRPSGVPWSPPLLRGRRGTTCTAKGSDVRPGVPPVSLGLRRFCVAGVGQRALPRGRMYALASLRCPLVSAAFAWQAWDNVHCQGVGCTPWRPVSLGLRRFCVAGVAQRALPRGRMYALASLRCPLVSAAFAWQAWHNVHCQVPWRGAGRFVA